MATEPAPAAYSPELDGLRAVAVAAVAYSHWLPGWQAGLPFGAGVHLFFVLSGFLITRILLGLRDGPDRGRAVARFYGRRALRLFPAFYLVLAAAWAADVPIVRETWAWHAAYLSNVFIASRAEWQGHLSHFWSLAVEEQFYLVWPWLIVWLPDRWLGLLVTTTILAGPAARLAASARGLGEPFWALVPAGSADSLALGAWLAWRRWRRPEDARPVVGASLVLGAAVLWVGLDGSERAGAVWPPVVTVWRQVLQGVVFAAVVERAIDGWRGLLGRVLQSRTLVAVGRISYGIYLIHAFAPVVVDAAWRALTGEGSGAWSPPVRALASGLATVGLAAVMWRLLETPFLRLKTRL